MYSASLPQESQGVAVVKLVAHVMVPEACENRPEAAQRRGNADFDVRSVPTVLSWAYTPTDRRCGTLALEVLGVEDSTFVSKKRSEHHVCETDRTFVTSSE